MGIMAVGATNIVLSANSVLLCHSVELVGSNRVIEYLSESLWII